MIKGKKVVVVMPAYNAAKTLRQTYSEIPHDLVDDIVLVDDASQDHTAVVSQELGIRAIIHPHNRGYGGNQKTCYRTALSLGADLVIMLHPDYQYTSRLITAMASLLAEGLFDCVLGSQILGVGARKGGMPLYKYVSNRALIALQNLLIGHKLSEYHTGYRGFTRELLEALPLDRNSDDFVFDNQLLSQIISGGYAIGEITCPTLYADDSSSINFANSERYGIGVVRRHKRSGGKQHDLRRSRHGNQLAEEQKGLAVVVGLPANPIRPRCTKTPATPQSAREKIGRM